MVTSNHIKKLLSKLSRGEISLPQGDAVHVTHLHDEWCDFWNGRGPCNCDPEIAEISNDPPSSTR